MPFAGSFKYRIIYILILFAFKNAGAQSGFYDRYKVITEKYKAGKLDEAMKNSLDALAAAERSGNPIHIAYANLKVGNMHYFLKEKRIAIKWYMIAMSVIEKEKIDSMKAEIYHNTSVMYNELHEIDSTLKYSKKSIDILKENKQYSNLSQALSALTDIYIHVLKDYKEAERLVIEAEKYAELSENEQMTAYAISKRAQLYGVQNKFKEAIQQLNIVGPIYRKYNSIEDMMYYYRIQSVYHHRLNDDKALSYTDSLLGLKDSVFKAETAKRTAEYATLYETEKKERENKLLQQENIIKQTQIDSRNRLLIGLLIGILLIGVLVAWRISIMNLKKKEKELESSKAIQKEKERISRDLHDNVGGQLSYVLYSVDGLYDKDTEKRMVVIENINESVRNVINNLRETIWAINDESVSVNDLSDKLKVYLRSMFKNTETKIIFRENIEKNMQLNSLTGLNIYRICQEIINNAFKHADASEVNVTLRVDARLEIVIRDNGKGFEKNTETKENYGMNNIANRAEEAGITIHFKSEKGEGTTFRLLV